MTANGLVASHKIAGPSRTLHRGLAYGLLMDNLGATGIVTPRNMERSIHATTSISLSGVETSR